MKQTKTFQFTLVLKKRVEDALFFSNINAALEERDSKTKEIRHSLLERISYPI